MRRPSLLMQLILVIAAVLLFGKMLVPRCVVVVTYTISLFLKDLLVIFLPFIVFSFVFSGITSLKKSAPTTLLILAVALFISNFTAVCVAYAVTYAALPTIVGATCSAALQTVDTIEPLWRMPLPQMPEMINALLRYTSLFVLAFGVLLGLCANWFRWDGVRSSVMRLKRFVDLFLSRFFIPLLPLYVAGFLLKMRAEGVFDCLIRDYGTMVFWIICVQIVYLGIFYFCASWFSKKKTRMVVRNTTASYVAGLTTMSSAVSVPVSIMCSLKNVKNASLVEMAMPILANVHLLGDALGIPIMVLVTLALFTGIVPPFSLFVQFAFFFALMLFAAAGVPGGGIIIMLPLIKTFFNFTPDMVGLIITLYVLMDAFGTAANVMGDGALVMIVDSIIKRFRPSDATSI